jgi:hypothetical protein
MSERRAMLAWGIPSEEEENEVKPSGEQKKRTIYFVVLYAYCIFVTLSP